MDIASHLDIQLKIDHKSGHGTMPLLIDGEPEQLRRALQKLMDNAVKYARGNILIGYRQLSDERCELFGEDDGGWY